MGTVPSSLWQDRLDGLKLDMNRINALLINDQIKLNPELVGKFTAPLSGLLNENEDLSQLSQNTSDHSLLWSRLTDQMQRVQAEVDAQLEILGGIGLAQGFNEEFSEGFDAGATRQVEEWLNQFIEPLGMENVSVLIGRGPLLDSEKRIVRLPFLDWDLWHIPLLGRALGLLILEEKKVGKKFHQIVDPLINQVEELFSDDSSQPPADLVRYLPEVQTLWQKYQQVATADGRKVFKEKNKATLATLAERQGKFLDFLFADQFATAVLGPAYAIPVFILELDYGSSNLLQIENPDLIEDRERAPRFLPASTQRAAAILETLEAMNRAGNLPEYEPGPYREIIQRLTALWQQMLAARHCADFLPVIRKQYQPWLESFYRQIIWDLFRTRILDPINQKDTKTDWQTAQAWHAALLAPKKKPGVDKPPVHILATAIWMHRLNYPAMADDLLQIMDQWEPDQWVAIKGSDASLVKVFASVQLNRLKNRWIRLAAILNSAQIPDADRAAVTGRFYRLLSEQFYELERAQNGIFEEQIRPNTWITIDKLYAQARPIQREGLEFLGGLLVHLSGLDREPGKITLTEEGASICNLADAILRDYVRRTGVNWNARTILGRNPFLEPSTDIIRVRFPDWSVWNLPLMAHEFGHVTAIATPAFQEYKKAEADLLKGEARVRLAHLDEYFADIFAVFTFGPAFALNAVLLQFNPAEAFLSRGVHPSHDERTQVILATLERMNEATQTPWDLDAVYGSVIKQIREIWRAGVEACQVKPDNEAAYTAQLADSIRWSRGLYRILDTFFRFGAGYSRKRWEFAQDLADKLSGIVPKQEFIDTLAQKSELNTVTLVDIINGFWIARARDIGKPSKVEVLTRLADRVCRSYTEG